ncbi:MAG TPA: GNAT family N-acetyltransferase [Blastocatellia bacterium]|nr:GNAT family N-acetyltransferase [Blastocatellia bacterium]
MIAKAEPEEVESLFPLLLMAEPSESALRWSLNNLSDTVYKVSSGEEVVGVATMRWQSEPCEIIELAVRQDRQGQGVGRQIIEWLIDEGRRRGKGELYVGTGNASIGNIVFYQRCGFRMDHVRRDYFWYHQEPLVEHGIAVRDMIVFRYNLDERQAR